ncbi:MAG: CPBP family intramembrane metalloprotease [Chloroflexi bacterium]|nr:CPBP family intramembrane metalloprotease [Chloroflexota bacterium]
MQQGKLWGYSVLPIFVINLGMMLAIGAYFALATTQPALVAGFDQGQLSFALSMFICIVEWAFAVSLIRRLNLMGIRTLIAASASLWKFQWLPALIVFVVLNAIFAAYIVFTIWTQGSWYRIEGLDAWQKIVMLVVVPLTAGFCEELIWRGYIFTQLEARGYGLEKAIVLSAVSFALIHGIMLPDKLLTTFLFGVVAGLYYARERNLIPLMQTHIVMDVWSFGLSVSS